MIECSVELIDEASPLAALKGRKIVLRTTVLHDPEKSLAVDAESEEDRTNENQGIERIWMRRTQIRLD